MNHDEFLQFVKEWSEAWKESKAEGIEGFGDEVELVDWLGSLEAYATIRQIADSGAEPKSALEQVIDFASQQMAQTIRERQFHGSDPTKIGQRGSSLCPKCGRYFQPCPVCK